MEGSGEELLRGRPNVLLNMVWFSGARMIRTCEGHPISGLEDKGGPPSYRSSEFTSLREVGGVALYPPKGRSRPSTRLLKVSRYYPLE